MTHLKIAILLCASAGLVAAETVEREFHISNSPSPQDLQEMATVFRTVFDIAELSIDTPAANIFMRGTPGQIAAVEWFVHDVEEPAEIRARAPHQYLQPTDRLPVVRAFYLNPAATQRYMQEVLTVVRTVVDIQKAFNLSGPRVIVMRGSKADLEMCGWIIDELGKTPDQSSGYSGVHQFRSTAKGDVVRIFYPEHSDRPNFATVLPSLRAQLKTQHLFAMSTPSALVLRGTPDQIASAEKMIGVR